MTVSEITEGNIIPIKIKSKIKGYARLITPLKPVFTFAEVDREDTEYLYGEQYWRVEYVDIPTLLKVKRRTPTEGAIFSQKVLSGKITSELITFYIGENRKNPPKRLKVVEEILDFNTFSLVDRFLQVGGKQIY